MEDHNDWVEGVLEDALIDGKSQYFVEHYDFDSKPSKDIVEREEIIIAKQLLEICWTEWLAYEENFTKFVFDGETFHDMIDDIPPSRLLEIFQHYFEGWLEGYHSSDESENSQE
jgi:hypothetical protein